MAGNRSAAWVFPLVILAVPGVMFYVWWSHLNAEQRKQMTMKIRRRTPEVFTASPDPNRLTNPIADAAAAAGAPPAVVAASTAPAASAAPTDAAAQAAPAPAGQAEAAPFKTPPLPEGGVTAPAPAPGDPAAAAAPGIDPSLIVIARDPTLSPYDLVRIEQRRLEAELRERELREGLNKERRRTAPPIESTIDLQGIVSTPDSGNKAIINGEMLGEGEFVGQAKVIRITSQGVVFLHKGRKFTKGISK